MRRTPQQNREALAALMSFSIRATDAELYRDAETRQEIGLAKELISSHAEDWSWILFKDGSRLG